MLITLSSYYYACEKFTLNSIAYQYVTSKFEINCSLKLLIRSNFPPLSTTLICLQLNSVDCLVSITMEVFQGMMERRVKQLKTHVDTKFDHIDKARQKSRKSKLDI